MSMPGRVGVGCDCGEQFVATVWTSVNTEDFELSEAFRQGTLNFAQCPRCSARFFIPYPVLYHDLDRGLMVQVYESDKLREPPTWMRQ